MEYLQSLSYYFDYYQLSHYQNYYQVITPLCFLLILYFLNGKDEKISRRRIRKLEENLMRNNTILDGLLLNTYKLSERQQSMNNFMEDIEARVDKFEENIAEFSYKDYENFTKQVSNELKMINEELKILHDATFLPDVDENDQDSDYEA